MLSIDGTSCSLESHLEVIIKVKFSTTARRAIAVRGDPRSRLSTPNALFTGAQHEETYPRNLSQETLLIIVLKQDSTTGGVGGKSGGGVGGVGSINGSVSANATFHERMTYF